MSGFFRAPSHATMQAHPHPHPNTIVHTKKHPVQAPLGRIPLPEMTQLPQNQSFCADLLRSTARLTAASNYRRSSEPTAASVIGAASYSMAPLTDSPVAMSFLEKLERNSNGKLADMRFDERLNTLISYSALKKLSGDPSSNNIFTVPGYDIFLLEKGPERAGGRDALTQNNNILISEASAPDFEHRLLKRLVQANIPDLSPQQHDAFLDVFQETVQAVSVKYHRMETALRNDYHYATDEQKRSFRNELAKGKLELPYTGIDYDDDGPQYSHSQQEIDAINGLNRCFSKDRLYHLSEDTENSSRRVNALYKECVAYVFMGILDKVENRKLHETNFNPLDKLVRFYEENTQKTMLEAIRASKAPAFKLPGAVTQKLTTFDKPVVWKHTGNAERFEL